MSDRVTCLTPGCRHTIGHERYVRLFKEQPGSWVCPRCWRRVPARLKRLNARHERERRKYGFHPREAAYDRLWGAIWRALQQGG